MIISKHLLAAARILMPSAGLGLICLGAFVKSIQSAELQILQDIFSYLLIILGFILLIAGVLWAIGHGMKSALIKRVCRRAPETDIQVFTVDRSAFYPPSYEESQARNEDVMSNTSIPTAVWWPGAAPPVYTESCTEAISEEFSHEQPPSYQQVFLQNLSEP